MEGEKHNNGCLEAFGAFFKMIFIILFFSGVIWVCQSAGEKLGESDYFQSDGQSSGVPSIDGEDPIEYYR
jgi:hypothetical protein